MPHVWSRYRLNSDVQIGYLVRILTFWFYGTSPICRALRSGSSLLENKSILATLQKRKVRLCIINPYGSALLGMHALMVWLFLGLAPLWFGSSRDSRLYGSVFLELAPLWFDSSWDSRAYCSALLGTRA